MLIWEPVLIVGAALKGVVVVASAYHFKVLLPVGVALITGLGSPTHALTGDVTVGRTGTGLTVTTKSLLDSHPLFKALTE